MIRFKENFYKYIWFMGGFAIGFTLISISHATIVKRSISALPQASQTSPAGELSGAKVNNPDFDQDFASLNQVEGKYAESWDEQQRIRTATIQATGQRVSPYQAAPRPVMARPAYANSRVSNQQLAQYNARRAQAVRNQAAAKYSKSRTLSKTQQAQMSRSKAAQAKLAREKKARALKAAKAKAAQNASNSAM